MSERFGWYAFPSDRTRSNEEEEEDDPEIESVRLRRDTYAGPFWDGGVHISDDFDELHSWLRISRELYDDAMAWNEEYASLRSAPTREWEDAHFARGQELLRRLRAEVPPSVSVPQPRARRPVVLLLSDRAVDVAALSLSPDVAQRLLAWRDEGERYQHATPANDAAIFAWETRGRPWRGRYRRSSALTMWSRIDSAPVACRS